VKRDFSRCIRLRNTGLQTLASLALLLCLFANARAQWTLVGSFPTAIGCGFFFDEDHGFINPCDPISIYKTKDGGVTWAATNVPRPMNGAVTSIYMLDQTTGYASIFSDGQFGKPALWRTLDGGNTWLNDLNVSGEGTSVYATSKAIIWTDWDDFIYGGTHTWGGEVSTDQGSTWTKRFRERGNGLDFTDDKIGVMTQMNPSPNNFWRTVDGGVTWIPTANVLESWSVYGVKRTKTFFTSNESQPGYSTTTINWSQDGGATWSPRFVFPFTTNIAFTGTLRGALSELYIQTDTGALYPLDYYGMLRSDNLGQSWKKVDGPANSRDTRFVVADCKGSTVYAFDPFGDVYKTINGGDGTLPDGNPADAKWSVDRDTIWLHAVGCSDSAEFNLASLACPYVHYDSTVISASAEVTLDKSGFGQIMHAGDSIKVRLHYLPTDTGSSLGSLQVRCHTSYGKFTKTIALVLRSDIPEAITLSKDTLHLSQLGCSHLQDTLSIVSNSCSAHVIDSVVFGDHSVALDAAIPTNSTLGAKLSLSIRYQSDTNSTHSDLVHVVGHLGAHRFDTTVAITGSTFLPKPTISLKHDTLFFPTSYCKSTSDTLRFFNPGCGSISIDSFESAAPFLFSASSHSLNSLGTDSVVIIFSPNDSGLSNGVLTIHLHAGRDSLTVPVILKGYNISDPNSVRMSKASITLSTANCSPQYDSITIYNKGCEQVIIDSVRALGEFSDTLLAPAGIYGGDSTRIGLSFRPDSGSSRMSTLHVYGHIGKTLFDSVVAITAANVLPVSPMSLMPDSIALITDHCQPVALPLLLHNNLCGAVEIDSVRIFGDSLFEFSCDTAGFGSLGSLRNGSVQVHFRPIARGLRSTSLHVYCHSGDKHFDTVLSVTGHNITAPEPYIGAIASVKAGDTVAVPIMLLPTTDTFSIDHVKLSLSFNTDLITPVALVVPNVKNWLLSKSTMTKTATGVSIDAYFGQLIGQDSDLSKPILNILMRAFLTKNITTAVTIDTFVTRVVGRERLCTIPDQLFTLALNCGDGTISRSMAHQPLGLSIISVNPNPANSSHAVLTYQTDEALSFAVAYLYDALGTLVSAVSLPKSELGVRSIPLSLPTISGRFELVLRDEFGRSASRSIIVEH
jgi:hypothetical protein